MRKMTPVKDIDEYLKARATQSQRRTLQNIRQLVKQVVPDAEEVISYGIPAFKYKKRILIYLAAFKNHMSIYPATSVDENHPLAKYKVPKGTLHFNENNLIPEKLLKEFISARQAAVS